MQPASRVSHSRRLSSNMRPSIPTTKRRATSGPPSIRGGPITKTTLHQQARETDCSQESRVILAPIQPAAATAEIMEREHTPRTTKTKLRCSVYFDCFQNSVILAYWAVC